MAGGAALNIRITADTKAFRDIKGAADSAASGIRGSMGGIGSAATAPIGAIGSLGNALGKIGIATIGILGVATAIKAVTASIASPIVAASNMAEAVSKIGVVFGDTKGEIVAFADTSAQAMGLSKQAALDAAGTFGNLFKAMGMGSPAVTSMSKDVVKLGSDLASFHNLDTADVLDKIRAGLVGETEPMRALGVVMNATMVENKALSMGLAATKGEITEAMKVSARYALILEQTKDAQGDFARTSTGMANATRIISASFADIQVQIGQRLLPIIAPLISSFATALPGAMNAVTPILDGFGATVTAVAADIGRLVRTGGRLADFFKKTAGAGLVLHNALERALGKQAANIIISAMESVRTVMPGVIAAIGDIVGAVDSVRVGILKVAGSLFVPILTAASAIVTSVVGVIGKLSEKIAPVLDDVVGSVQQFGGQMVAVGRYITAVVTDGDVFNDWLTHLPDAVQPALLSVGKLIKTFDGIGRQVSNAVITGDMAPLRDALANWVDEVWPKIKAKAGDIAANLKKWIEDQPALIKERVGEWSTALSGWVDDVWPKIKRNVGNVTAGLLAWLAEQPALISARVGEWSTAISAWVTTAWPKIKERVGEISNGLLTWITEQVPLLKTRVGEWATAFGGWIGDTATKVTTDLPGIINSVTKWIGEQVTVIATKAGEWGKGFVDWIVPVAGQVLAALPGIVNTVTKWIGDQAVTIGISLGKWIAAFVDWITLVDPVARLGEIATNIGTWVTGTALPAIQAALKTWTDAFVEWVLPANERLGPELGGIQATVLDAIAAGRVKIGEQIATWATTLTDWMGPVGPEMLGRWKLILRDLLAGITAGIGPIAATAGEMVLAFLERLIPALPAITAAILGFIATTVVEIGSALVGWAVAFSDWVWKEAQPRLTKSLNRMYMNIAEWILGRIVAIATDAAQLGVSFVAGLAKGINDNLINSLNQTSADIAAWINTAAATVKTTAASIGSGIVTGIWDGIQAGWGWLLGKVAEFVGSLIDRAKKVLDSGSPSLEFAKVGASITDGLALGIASGAVAVQTQIADLATSLVSAMPTPNTFYQAGADIVQGAIDGIASQQAALRDSLAKGFDTASAAVQNTAARVIAPSIASSTQTTGVQAPVLNLQNVIVGQPEFENQINAVETAIKRLDIAKKMRISPEQAKAMFPLIGAGAEEFVASLGNSRKALEKWLEIARLRGDLTFGQQLREAGLAAEAAAKDAASAAGQAAKDAAELAQSIVDNAKDIADSQSMAGFFKVGQNITDAIAQGVRDRNTSMLDTLSSGFGSAVSTVESLAKRVYGKILPPEMKANIKAMKTQLDELNLAKELASTASWLASVGVAPPAWLNDLIAKATATATPGGALATVGQQLAAGAIPGSIKPVAIVLPVPETGTPVDGKTSLSPEAADALMRSALRTSTTIPTTVATIAPSVIASTAGAVDDATRALSAVGTSGTAMVGVLDQVVRAFEAIRAAVAAVLSALPTMPTIAMQPTPQRVSAQQVPPDVTVSPPAVNVPTPTVNVPTPSVTVPPLPMPTIQMPTEGRPSDKAMPGLVDSLAGYVRQLAPMPMMPHPVPTGEATRSIPMPPTMPIGIQPRPPAEEMTAFGPGGWPWPIKPPSRPDVPVTDLIADLRARLPVMPPVVAPVGGRALAPIVATPAMGSPGQAGGSVVNHNEQTYHVTVHTNATSGTYRQDIELAKAMANA